MSYVAANSFNSIVGYGKIVGIGGTNTAGVGRPRDYYYPFSLTRLAHTLKP